MKKSLALILAVVMVLCLALTGCGAGSTAMTVCVGPYPDTIDPALNSAVDGATYVIHAFAGLAGYEQAEDGSLKIVADCAKELPEAVATDDGKVSYTFELKDDLKWSDGSELTAADFVWAWNRAVSPDTAADYGYMFDVIDGYAEAAEGKGELNVTASEDGKSLTVVLNNDVPYFYELLAFPTYMPVKKDVVEGKEDWATKAETYIGNGPYTVTEFTQSQLVMEKNKNYHNADAIKTEKIVFPFNEDDASLYANFKNGAYMFIDSVPNDQIKTIEKDHPDEYKVMGQLGTYYVCFNMNDPALADFTEEEKVSIRKALGLMLERNYICEEIGMAGQQPANSFVPIGLTDADGKTEFVATNGTERDGKGYFSVAEEDFSANCEEAIELLTAVADSSGKFTVDGTTLTGFPTLTYITNEGTAHEQLATYMQGEYAKYGITLKIEVQEWNTFLDTRKSGDYSIARNGWLSDYNDPISFLDMWITESGNNDCQFGKDAHAEYAGYSYDGKDGLTWAESYDKIITTVKASTDPEERFELMHKAEDIIMSTGAISPIYYYTDQYMCSTKIDGFFASPLGYKYFMYATIAE
ncbi:MAG: peptide ABC transporter substrate-binding protein [Ruminococcus sp.]|nr:peptide ABC transporter substrate-binding protein [Ruminococcus sp.]MBQ9743472.1 peptide ABC transporter substrate-binding protein [Ruminococcus sp.]